jgi:hypothetical protein
MKLRFTGFRVFRSSSLDFFFKSVPSEEKYLIRTRLTPPIVAALQFFVEETGVEGIERIRDAREGGVRSEAVVCIVRPVPGMALEGDK